jgi:hypothetical protein
MRRDRRFQLALGLAVGASRWGRLCSDLLAFAVIAVAELRWEQV